MTLFWASLDPAIQAAIIGVSGTFVTAALALLGLGWQLRSQGNQSRDAIAENERRKLKAEMFENAITRTRAVIDAVIALSTPLRIASAQLQSSARTASFGHEFPLPTARANDFTAKYSEFSQAVLRFIGLVEERRFVDPRMLVFRSAMMSVLHDVGTIFYGQLFPRSAIILPSERPDGTIFYNAPSPEAAEAFNELCEQFISSLDDASSYAEDFSVEMQNLLHGDLFGHDVRHRVPIDPARKVVTLKDSEKLDAWFNAETAWGKHCAEVEARVAQQLCPPAE